MAVHAPRLPFSLHPLIAEAKRRARQRRLLVTVVVLVLATGAAGLGIELSSRGPARAVPANLVITANRFGHSAEWHLSCVPAKGDVPDPAAACAAIAAQPSVVTYPHAVYYGCDAALPWTFTISGRVDNRQVLRTLSISCWNETFITKLGLIPRLRSAQRS